MITKRERALLQYMLKIIDVDEKKKKEGYITAGCNTAESCLTEGLFMLCEQCHKKKAIMHMVCLAGDKR